MFSTTSRWGFPYRATRIVELYEKGVLTLKEALSRLSGLYGSNIKTYYTYDGNGNKISHTCIEFGCPVVMQYVF